MPFTLVAALAATLCTWKPASTGNPIDRFFSATKVECQEAKAGAVARDRVNVFVRGDDRIGVDVALTNRISEEALQQMLDRARPVARVKVNALADGDALFAYIPETAVAIPLLVSDGVALVPAETTFILLAVSDPSPTGRRCRGAADEGPCKSEITGVSALVRVDAPHPASGHPLPEGEGVTLTKRAIVGWLQAKLPTSGAPKSSPIVMLDGKHKPDAALKLDASPLLIFRNASDGKHELTLRGDSWKTQTVALESKDITIVKAPLVATPSRNLTVRWTLLNDPATLAPKEEACDAPAAKVSGPMTMALRDCPGMQPNARYMSVDQRTCRDAATVNLPEDQRHGRAELHDLASGPYLLRFSRERLPDLWQSIVIPDDRDGEVAANVEYYRLFGTITRGGKPVRANLAVSGGETVSDADGKYEVTITESRFGNMLTIIPCDTGQEYRHITDERPPANSRFDVDIPQNVLKVDVADDADGKPIPKARVSFGLLMKGQEGDEGSAWYGSSADPTDENGRTLVKQTDKEHRVLVCAQREDYERKCADPFRFEEQAEVGLRLALKKLILHDGRVHVAGAIDSGVIFWDTRDGVRIEQARVKEDGNFTYGKTHPPGTIVSFLSSSHPLYVFQQPPVNDALPFEFALPSAPVRSFELVLDDAATGPNVFFTLALGDLTIPMGTLSSYAPRHGTRNSIRKGGTAVVRDILETAPISIVVVSMPFFEANNVAGRDLALVPAAGSLPRYRLGNESRITVNDH
ncbi:MAG: hypothetical protein JWO97_170 [Acidobacteria bacterium]|nr:hypothetical protein [Acidobacteriota bacterium]